MLGREDPPDGSFREANSLVSSTVYFQYLPQRPAQTAPVLLQVEHVVMPVLPLPLHAVQVLSTDPHLGHFTRILSLHHGAATPTARPTLSHGGRCVLPTKRGTSGVVVWQ